MNDTIEKKLKELLPYIIIIGAIFLLFPLLMSKDEGASTYIIQLGVFPLTVLTCGAVYRIRSRKTDLSFCAIAPLFYALTALLYGMWRAWLTVLIYLAAYLLCGYLGQMLGEILPFGKKKATDSDNESSSLPRRVNVDDGAAAEAFLTEDPAHDDALDASTTENDIEAILDSIHNRK